MIEDIQKRITKKIQTVKNWYRAHQPIYLPVRLIIVLIASAILMVSWVIAVPFFESPDEGFHTAVVSFVSKNGTLPNQELTQRSNHFTPLYYYWAAQFVQQGIKSSEYSLSLNPQYAGKLEYPYSRDHITANWNLRAIRFSSVILSLFTVLFSYWAGYEATRNQSTALLITGLVAFLPQFTFRGMNISNDAMLATTSAFVTWLIVRIIKRRFNWRIGLLAGFALGLVFLSKYVGAVLVFPLTLAIVTEKLTWKQRIIHMIGVLGIFALVCSPWIIRNQLLYNAPLSSRTFMLAPITGEELRTNNISREFWAGYFVQTLAKSFIGLFGWMSIFLTTWMYQIYGFLALLAGLGYIAKWFNKAIQVRLTIILLITFIINFLIIAEFNIVTSSAQGRYFFPVLTMIMILWGIGLSGLPFWSSIKSYLLLALLYLLNVYILISIIIPTYWSFIFNTDRILSIGRVVLIILAILCCIISFLYSRPISDRTLKDRKLSSK